MMNFKEYSKIAEDTGGNLIDNSLKAAGGDCRLGYQLYCLVSNSLDKTGEGLIISYIGSWRGDFRDYPIQTIEDLLFHLSLLSDPEVMAKRRARRKLRPSKSRRSGARVHYNAMGRSIPFVSHLTKRLGKFVHPHCN